MPPGPFVVAPRRDCDGSSVFPNPAVPSPSSRIYLTGKSSSRRIAFSTVPPNDWFGSWASGIARSRQRSLPPNTVLASDFLREKSTHEEGNLTEFAIWEIPDSTVEEPYEFVDVDGLMADFASDVRRVTGGTKWPRH